MSLAAEVVFQHRRLEPLSLALLAGGRDRVHESQFGVDDAGAVAGGAGTLGVGAEQRRLHAVGLRERRADRVEQSGVRRRVAPSRAADRGLVDRRSRRPGPTPSRGSVSSFPSPATPVTTTSTPSGMSTSTSCRLWALAPRTSEHARGCPHRRLQGGPVVQMAAGDRAAGPQPVDGSLEHHLAAGRTGAWAEIDDVVGDLDRLRLVLDDEHACCPCRAAAAAGRSSAGCRGGAGRSWARRRRR